MSQKLTVAQLTPIRNAMLAQQNYKCALCGVSFKTKVVKNGKSQNKYTPCVDHCHKHGHIRAILCNNCNGKEGKVMKLAIACQRQSTPLNWLVKLVAYLQLHETPQTNYIHPKHKTDDEKRLDRNKKARLARARKQASKMGF